MSTDFKYQIKVGLIVLAVGVAIIVGWQYLGKTSQVKERNQLYQELIQFSGQLNRDLPKLLDRQTRFERAEVVNYGMRFIYTMVQVDRFQQDVENLQAQIEPQMLQQYCQGESLAFYREYADFIEFRYLDKNELVLFSLRFKPNDCKG